MEYMIRFFASAVHRELDKYTQDFDFAQYKQIWKWQDTHYSF